MKRKVARENLAAMLTVIHQGVKELDLNMAKDLSPQEVGMIIAVQEAVTKYSANIDRGEEPKA